MSCKKHKLINIMFKNKHIVFVYQAVVNYFSNNVTCNNLKNLCSRSVENEIFFQHSDITFFRLVGNSAVSSNFLKKNEYPSNLKFEGRACL